MSDITYGLKALTGAITITKNLKDLKKQLDNSTFHLQISELYDNLADTKMGMAELKDVLIEKDNEIRTLKEKLKVRGAMVYTDPYYQLKNDEGELEGPYCKVCYDGEKLLMRLESIGNNSWLCGRCENRCFETKGPMMSGY